MNDNSEMTVEDLINLVILECPDYNRFIIDATISRVQNNNSLKLKKAQVKECVYALKSLDYVEIDDLQLYKLTALGRFVKSTGGHYEYLKYLDERDQSEKYIKKIETENLLSSTRLNKWLYWTRWWPLIISIIALVFSILAYLKSTNMDTNIQQQEFLNNACNE